jgi:hypothetical protein
MLIVYSFFRISKITTNLEYLMKKPSAGQGPLETTFYQISDNILISEDHLKKDTQSGLHRS